MLFKATEGCHEQLCKVWPRPVQAFLPLKEWVFKKKKHSNNKKLLVVYSRLTLKVHDH